MGIWSLFKGRRQASAGSENVEPDYEKAREILEKYNFSFSELRYHDKDFDEYSACRLPKELFDQWLREAFEKNKEEFRQSCENGTPEFAKLDFVCRCTNSFADENIIRDSYEIVLGNAEKIGFEKEIICYNIISSYLSAKGIACSVSREDFQYVLGGIIERMDHIFQADAEMQEKYQRMYTNCQIFLAEIDQYYPAGQ